jgi:TfoX/Sxy family transcriptional regulator of competence genes
VAYDEKLAERMRDVIGAPPGYGEMKMFGGIAFSINGNMACGVMKDDMLVRIPSEQFDALVKSPGARPMDMMRAGRTPTGFLLIGPDATKTKAGLERWVKRGLDHATSLPPKAAKKKPGAKVASRGKATARGKAVARRPVAKRSR